MSIKKGTRVTPASIAKAEGKLTYYTGIPCKRGHISERRTSTQSCIQCCKEIHSVTDRDNYRNSANTFERQFNSRRQNAIRFSIPFSIKFADIEQPTHCPVFGIELNYGWSGKDRRDPAKASLDKIVPELGYVLGNVRVISWKANKLKSNMTLEELEKIMNYIKENTHASI